ncbi:hypothetical protein [Pedobacter duraquae]|uniref:Uncharacterized protein n=1 Tax=Pedobacter duraquae TaxID=425511 RepID=A0A4R6IGR6_9SPHI|nr:hypothetical protein [Pedobacter duraquae]TDO20948.1 hypothetical protein CLV32_3585 [Pedobacter duraquae]
MKILAFFYLILFSITTYAQSTWLEKEKFINQLNRNFKTNLLPDSDALYTLNIQIVLDKNSRALITSNNAELFDKIGVLPFLQQYNYKPLIGEVRPLKVMVPIGIIVGSSKYGPKTIDLHIADKLSNLFYHEKPEDDNIRIVYLSSVILFVDKKVYH